MALFSTGIRRKAPWPYHVTVNGTGLMCGYGSQEDVQIVYESPPDQQSVTPGEYAETSQNPIFGRYQAFGDLNGGFGLRNETPGVGNRYWYAIGYDASQGQGKQGPLITVVTPGTTDSTNGVSGFAEMNSILYAIVGRYALSRTNDSTWAVSQDFTAGKVATGSAVFTSNFNGVTYLFVAMGDSEKFWYANAAASWNQHTTMYARAFQQVSREFWRASSTNLLSKVDTDASPLTEANWTATNAFRVGSQDAGVVRMGATIADSMYVFKTDGIYTLDEAGDDKELFPFLRQSAASTNASAFCTWKNNEYVAYGNSLYELTPDGALKQVGPELLSDNDSPIKGRITSLCGTQYALYAGIFNPDGDSGNGSSYLLKWEGNWGKDSNGKDYAIWHGSLSGEYTGGVKITALHSSTVGAASGHNRLWLGFSNGTIGYMTLPCTPNPIGCSTYRYSTTTGVMYLPTLSFGFPSEYKAIRSFSVTALGTSVSDYVKVGYNLSPAAAGSGTYTDTGENFDAPPREQVVVNGLAAVLLDVKVSIVNTVSTSSPRVIRVAIEHQLRTQLRKVFSFNVLAEDGLVTQDNTPMRIGAYRIRQVLESARETPVSVTINLPDDVSRRMTVISTTEGMAWDRPRKSWRSAIKVTATEDAESFGLYDRLEAYTYDQLELYTYDQITAL